ncbi:MAG: hypothetical protein ACR2RA_16900 [Geminicoccaceae bacterium]
MTSAKESTAGPGQHVSSLISMQINLTLMVIAPAIILGAVAIGAQNYAKGMSDKAIQEIIQTDQRGSHLAATTQKIQASAGQFEDDLVALAQQRQQDLLRNRKPAGGQQIAKLRDQAMALSSLVDRDLALLREVMVGSAEHDATESQALALFEKRYNFVTRNARNVSRLLDIYLASHERTAALFDRQSFDRARANYIFEESAQPGNPINR